MHLSNPNRYARVAGALFLVSAIAGYFGEMQIPSQVAKNLRSSSDPLMRIGFAAYLTEAMCDIALSLILYELLRPVNKALSLLAAFFGLVGTAIFAFGEIFYFAAPVALRNGGDALGALWVRMYWVTSGISMLFYGVPTFIRGCLMVRSTYLPRFLGVLVAIAGAGFIAYTAVFVLAPRYASNIFLMPMGIAMLALVVWLLVKGVDREKWNAMVSA